MPETGININEIIGVIAPNEMTITLTVLGTIFLILIVIVYYTWKKGWILVKHPIKVTIREQRGDSLSVRNRTKGRLVEEGNKSYYRIRNGFLPWNNIDWVPPPDYRFIDARDHLELYAPNRDEYHAIMPEIKEAMTAKLAEKGHADIKLEVDVGPGQLPVLVPIDILPPEVRWKQDMSTAAKAFYRMGTEDIARRSAVGSWFKEYQGIIAMVVVGMFLLFLFYLSWQPLVDNSQTTAAALKTQKETVESLERIQNKLGVTQPEEEKEEPPPGG